MEDNTLLILDLMVFAVCIVYGIAYSVTMNAVDKFSFRRWEKAFMIGWFFLLGMGAVYFIFASYVMYKLVGYL